MKNLTIFGLSALIPALLITSNTFAAPQTSNVFVSISGGSMSLVRCQTRKRNVNDVQPGSTVISCAEKENEAIGVSFSWPAQQYRGNDEWWWAGVTSAVIAMKANASAKPLLSAKNLMEVNTYTYDGVPPGLPTRGSNFIGITPDGKTAWNSAREIDEIQEIDSDPESATFGQILSHISVPISDFPTNAPGRGKMRPCDMSITPDGKYLWEPDLGGETITGVDIENKTVIAQLLLPRENTDDPNDPDTRVKPFMLTTNGKYALVENFEAPAGSESIIDVSDPSSPKHLKKLTPARDGLGVSPTTSEFTPDGKYAYIMAGGSPSSTGVISVLNLETLHIDKNIALPVNCRAGTGDFTNDGGFFVVNCPGTNSLAVVSNELQAVVQEVALSGRPRGITVR